MKKIAIIAIIYSGCLLPLTGHAQSVPVNLPKIVPPPAEAATLGKYGDIPVSLHTGSANISVPVYEIKSPRLSLPITLNYTPTGIKVDERASWVGLGWSLDAGGIITRTIRGLDDFLSANGYYDHSIPPDADTITQFYSWQYLDQVANGNVDTEPDQFFFNFSGNSGKYVFGENKLPMIINYQQPLKIIFSSTTNSFTILDGQGIQYIFSEKDTTQSYYTMASNSPAPNRNQIYTSSWLLTKIISFDKSDTISFSYYKDNEQVESYLSYSEAIGDVWNCTSPTMTVTANTHSGQNEISSQSFIRNKPKRLSEIIFRNGKITFHSSANRSDAAVAKLDSVRIFRLDPLSQSYRIMRKTRFYYSYFATTGVGQDAYRLRLDSVRTFGSGNEDGGRHAFSYNTSTLPGIGNKAKDLFGYYNGQTTNTSLIPRDTILYTGTMHHVGGANRQVDPNYIKVGILERVTYPTGGFTNFEYEPNSYFEYGTKSISKSASATGDIDETDTLIFTASATAAAIIHAFISRYDYAGVQTPPFVSLVDLTTSETIYLNGVGTPAANFEVYDLVTLIQGHNYRLVAKAFDDDRVFSGIGVTWKEADDSVKSKYGGGLRIKSTTSFAWDGKFATSERYSYGSNECGFGFLPGQSFLLNTFSSERMFYFGCTAGGANCVSQNSQRKIYNASTIYDVFNLASSQVSYPEVSKYSIDSLGNSIGKTVYQYSMYSNSTQPGSLSYYEGLSVVNSGWIGGQLIAQVDYSLKNGIYFPVRKILNGYDSISLQVGRGFKANYTHSISGCFITGPTGNPGYYAIDYPIYSGASLPSTQLVYSYDQKDTTRFSVAYQKFSYANLNHIQPTIVKASTSNGDTLYTVNRYPIDKDSIAGLTIAQRAALDSLVSRHSIATLVQSQTFRNADPVVLRRNDFKLLPTGLIVSDSIKVQNSNFPIESRLQYHKYDAKGNVIQVAKTGDVNTAYIWDYDSALPIAEAVNADSAYIAYTSFETPGKGQWLFSGAPFVDNMAPTGRKVYKLASGDISKSGLSNSATYIVSYWSKNGAQSVNGSSPASGHTVGSWQFWVHKVSNPAGGTITVSGSGTIDELRLYPEQSQMISFVYQPLVGIAAQSDISGSITYYEYDELQRLILIRDQDKRILKKICYNYAGQSENCSIYYNVEKSGNFTRTCSSPYVGGQVTYTVPEGSYSSTSSQEAADALAQNDVNSNGQAYAEANGVCLSPFNGRNLTSVPWTITVTGVSETFNGGYNLSPNCLPTFLANLPLGVYNISMTPFTNIGSVQLILNGSTYNGTSFSLTNITINAETTFYLVGSCSITMASGFTSPTKSISNDGLSVSFFMVFSRNSSMSAGNTYSLGTVSQSCKPCAQRSVNFSSMGRSWTITIATNGAMSLTFNSGTSVPANTTISTPTLSYNL